MFTCSYYINNLVPVTVTLVIYNYKFERKISKTKMALQFENVSKQQIFYFSFITYWWVHYISLFCAKLKIRTANKTLQVNHIFIAVLRLIEGPQKKGPLIEGHLGPRSKENSNNATMYCK